MSWPSRGESFPGFPWTRAGQISQHRWKLGGVLRQVVRSSSLRSVGYDAERHLLEIEFSHGGVYRYENVPPSVWLRLKQAPSKGTYFHDHIRDTYATERIS